MGRSDHTVERVQFLVGSRCRVGIFEALFERGPTTKRTLKSIVDCDRTTLQRNLDALEERDWVERDGTTHALVRTGSAVAETFFPFLDRLETASDLSGFLRWLPEDDFDLDVQAFDDASVTVVEKGNPYAAVNRHIDALSAAETARMLLPEVGLPALKTSFERVAAGKLELEIVFGPTAADAIRRDATLADQTSQFLVYDTYAGYVAAADADVPFYLGLFDHTVQVGVADEEGIPSALSLH